MIRRAGPAKSQARLTGRLPAGGGDRGPVQQPRGQRAERRVAGAQRQPAPGLQHHAHPPGLPGHPGRPGPAQPVVRVDRGAQRRPAPRRGPAERSVAASSKARQAPWARWCGMAWAASPSSTTPPAPTGKPNARGSGRSSAPACWTRSSGLGGGEQLADRRVPAGEPAAQQGELGRRRLRAGRAGARSPPSRCRPGSTRRPSRARPARRPRTASPAPSVSPAGGAVAGSRGARYQGITARQAA